MRIFQTNNVDKIKTHVLR